MDPIDIADFILEMAAGLFAVLLSAGFGVSITPRKKSHDLPSRCFAVSYDGTSIVAAALIFFVAVSLGCALTVKYIYKRAADGNAEQNSSVAWRLVYVLIPLAGVTHIVALSFFLMVTRHRLGKIGCWRIVTRVVLFGACFGATVAGFILGMVCYYYGRVDAPILDGNDPQGVEMDDVFFSASESAEEEDV